MGDLIAVLRENGAVIAGAPLAAVVWSLVIGGIIYAVLKALMRNQADDLRSRLQLRDDEIADYKRKLEGATPDEAAARIADLEAAVAKLEVKPRDYEAELAAIISELAVKPKDGPWSIHAAVGDASAHALANMVHRYMTGAGFGLAGGVSTSLGHGPPLVGYKVSHPATWGLDTTTWRVSIGADPHRT